MSSFTPCSSLDENVDRPLQALSERVHSVLSEASSEPRRLVRVSVPLAAPVEPIQWLRAQESAETVYWSPRTSTATQGVDPPETNGASQSEEGPTIAGIGQADRLSSRRQPIDYQRLERRLAARLDAAPADVRYFGGLRFDAPQPHPDETSAGPWTSFGTYRFVLPRVELVDRADRQILACNLVLPRDADRIETLPAVIESLEAAAPSEDGSTRSCLRGRSPWASTAASTRSACSST